MTGNKRTAKHKKKKSKCSSTDLKDALLSKFIHFDPSNLYEMEELLKLSQEPKKLHVPVIPEQRSCLLVDLIITKLLESLGSSVVSKEGTNERAVLMILGILCPHVKFRLKSMEAGSSSRAPSIEALNPSDSLIIRSCNIASDLGHRHTTVDLLRGVPTITSYMSDNKHVFEGMTYKQLPNGFAVGKISICGKSCVSLNASGRSLIRVLLLQWSDIIEKGQFFLKLDPERIYAGTHGLQIDLDVQNLSDCDKEDKRDIMGKMVSEFQTFVETICGGRARVPHDLCCLVSLIRSEAADGDIKFWRCSFGFIVEHSSVASLLYFKKLLSKLRHMFRLHGVFVVDEEANKVLDGLDSSVFPGSWLRRVKKVARSDPDYRFFITALDISERKTRVEFTSRFGPKCFQGIRGLIIFLSDLVRIADELPFPENMERCHRIYKALSIMFPHLLCGIFEAVYRSPFMRNSLSLCYLFIMSVSSPGRTGQCVVLCRRITFEPNFYVP